MDNQKETFGTWCRKHIYLFIVIGGVLLLVLTLKTQTVLVTDTSRECTVQLEYSVFGYCVSAVPMTDNAHKIATEYTFFLGGMDDTVEKTALWINEQTGKNGVELYVSGYPRSASKLIERYKERLAKLGVKAERFEQ